MTFVQTTGIIINVHMCIKIAAQKNNYKKGSLNVQLFLLTL